MRKLSLLVPVVLLLCHSVASGQVQSPSLWSKTFGGEHDEVASDVVVRRDGSLVVNGQKTIYADDSRNLFKSQSDALLLGLSDHGEMLWQQTLGGAGSDTFYAFAGDPDSGLLLAGSTDSDVEKIAIWAVRTDKNGKIQRRNVIPGDDDMSVSGGLSLNGQLIVCGREWAGIQLKWQAFVTALNDDFKVQWKRSIGDREFDDLSSVVESSDGSLIALGKLGTESGFHDLLLKLDPQGNEVWRQVIPRPDGQYRTKLLASRDGGFTTFGSQQSDGGSDLWIQKFDASGKALWQKRIPSTHDDSVSSVLALSDGGYLVAGSRETQFSDERRKFNATLSCLTADGNVSWQHSFPADGHTSINGLAQLKSGVAIAVGSVVDAKTKNADAWVFTFTLSGEVPDAVRFERH